MGSRVSLVFSASNLVYILIFAGGIFLYVIYQKKKRSEQLEVAKLRAFLAFLDSVSYEYTICQCVEEAVLTCLETVDALIEDMIEEFYQILITEEQEGLTSFQKNCTSKFYYHFLLYSYLAMEYGDSATESVFLKNILFLKKQVFIWILNREKLEHYLRGLVWLILVPIQFLKGIEIWAGWNLQDLNRYYSGTYGLVTRFLLVFITLLCYQILIWLRSVQDARFHQNKLLSKLIKNKYIRQYYQWWIEYHPQKVKQLSSLLRESSSRMELQEFWLLRRIIGITGGVAACIMLGPIIGNGKLSIFWVCGVSLLSAGILYWIPVWYLRVRILLIEKQKEDEVFFFYGITFLVVMDGNGDVDCILEWLLMGADIFEPAVQTCLDEYAYDNETALTKGKEMAPFAPFVKMLDAFLISERIGLKQAVFPLQMELQQFLEKRKQDNEIITSNKGVIGSFIALIPMVCIIGLYVIVPFVLESLYQLRVYVKQIQIGL